MNHNDIKNMLGAYCLGALDEKEKELMDTHFEQGCRDCEATKKEMQMVVETLPLAAPAVNPPSNLKEKILASIQTTETLIKPKKLEIGVEESLVHILQVAKKRWMRLSWALAFTVVLVLIGLEWYSQNLQDKISFLENQLQMNQRLVQELSLELSKREEIIKVVQSPAIRIVDLKGLEAAPAAKGKIFWNPGQNKAVFSAFNLPQAPSENDYQLWMIKGKQPIDAGTFSVDAEGKALIAIDTIADSENLAAFAVTLEPKGGVPQPTGVMFLLGAVKKS